MSQVAIANLNLLGGLEKSEIHEQNRLRLGFLNLGAWRAISQELGDFSWVLHTAPLEIERILRLRLRRER